LKTSRAQAPQLVVEARAFLDHDQSSHQDENPQCIYVLLPLAPLRNQNNVFDFQVLSGGRPLGNFSVPKLKLDYADWSDSNLHDSNDTGYRPSAAESKKTEEILRLRGDFAEVSISRSQTIIRFQHGMLWDANNFNHLQDIAISPRVHKRPIIKSLPCECLEAASL